VNLAQLSMVYFATTFFYGFVLGYAVKSQIRDDAKVEWLVTGIGLFAVVYLVGVEPFLLFVSLVGVLIGRRLARRSE